MPDPRGPTGLPGLLRDALARAGADLGVQPWLVGGYVRDRLLGRSHPDLDVVVEGGRGLELATRFAELVGTRPPVVFERFGTAQVRAGGSLVEFVSARRESYAPDSRKPEVTAATLDEDLRRRDLTVNTLLMDLEGRVHDRLGTGLADLEARVLRTPLDPVRTFSDDPLRVLRVIRFGAQLGFDMAPELLPAMSEIRGRLAPPVVSIERVTDELVKILVSPRPGWALTALREANLLEPLLPELAACVGVVQGGWHTHDVFGHTVGVVDGVAPDLVTRLAALFHDSGKPGTATPDGSFHGHERVGAEIARTRLTSLRLPGPEIDRVARLVTLHMRAVFYERGWTDGAVRRLAAAAGEDVGRLIDLARADLAASAYPDRVAVEDLAERIGRALDERPSRMELAVTGEDIMATLGIGPGPMVGRVKRHLLELVMEGGLPPDRETILGHLRREADGLARLSDHS